MLPQNIFYNFEIANITNNYLFFSTLYELYPNEILNYAVEKNLYNFIDWFSSYNGNDNVNQTDLERILISFVDQTYFIEQEYILFLIDKFIKGILPNVKNGENILYVLQERIGKSIFEIQNMLINMNVNIDLNNYKFIKIGKLNFKEYRTFLKLNGLFLESVNVDRLRIIMK